MSFAYVPPGGFGASAGGFGAAAATRKRRPSGSKPLPKSASLLPLSANASGNLPPSANATPAKPATPFLDTSKGELSELADLLNSGTASGRESRRKEQEAAKAALPPPSRGELQVMSVQDAVAAMLKNIDDDKVVVATCERWQALGYGPGRRQSAAESGALEAIPKAMKVHAGVALVQEKGALAVANICSGVDEPGLARKAQAFAAGCLEAIVAGMRAFPDDAPVLSNSSAALGNICYAADNPGLARKHAAYEAGVLKLIADSMVAFPDDVAVCENGAFALGNICRAVGKVGNSSTGDFAAPELAPIDEQLRQRQEGVARKQAAAEAGALEATVAAMKTHASSEGVMSWGARALSIITYESAPLREQAKKAGAKMQWLMGLSEDMDSAQKAREIPLSKTGRAPGVTGRITGGRSMQSVRGPKAVAW